jgi:hypothetical protein
MGKRRRVAGLKVEGRKKWSFKVQVFSFKNTDDSKTEEVGKEAAFLSLLTTWSRMLQGRPGSR